MKTVNTIREIKEEIKAWKTEGLSIGFVPTMGFLHEGHQSLIKKAVEENDKVVVSIYVNPMQFAPTEDFHSYPRDLNADSKLCENTGADLIFYPHSGEIYPSDFCTFVDIDNVTNELCGKSRPGHFKGVCTIVNKLFNIVMPTRAYFGEKDAQQLAVIKKMVSDLNMDIEIVPCPLIRETDGLAKSSRNSYLNTDERKAALILSKAISEAKCLVAAGEKNIHTIIDTMKNIIQTEPLAKIDYIEVVDNTSIKKIDKIRSNSLVAIAVYIGKVRLIDNFYIKEVASNDNHSFKE